MASNSKCPKCENSTFELAIETPKGSAFKLGFIRCASCGCVVGTTEYFSTSDLIIKLANALGKPIN